MTLVLGPTDLLVDTPDPIGFAAAARAMPGVTDAVPGDGCVLVRGVADLPATVAPVAVAGRAHDIPVVYDGPDLATFGLPVEEVVARHTASAFRVAFLGFSPGFGYLDGLDPALRRPRLDAPRSRVPALSVGVAGARGCVYPTASPGGWRLLGRAVGIRPFDPWADPPSLLAPGDTVAFRAVDAGDVAGPPVPPAARHPGPWWSVLDPGAQTVVVDAGRPGWGHVGVPRTGALDLRCLARANALVGNPDATAGLEAVLRGPVLEGPRRWVAVVWPGGERVERTDRLDLRSLPAWRVWVAVEGGLDVAPVLGSRSSDLLGRIGPPALTAGEVLPVGSASGRVGVADRPAASSSGVLRVRPGPDADLLDAALGTWIVLPDSDRAGVRLDRPAPVSHDRPGRTIGLVAGMVQLPPGGRPVVFQAGHPATGGYPVVGVVLPGDLGALAQLRPGDPVTLTPEST